MSIAHRHRSRRQDRCTGPTKPKPNPAERGRNFWNVFVATDNPRCCSIRSRRELCARLENGRVVGRASPGSSRRGSASKMRWLCWSSNPTSEARSKLPARFRSAGRRWRCCATGMQAGNMVRRLDDWPLTPSLSPHGQVRRGTSGAGGARGFLARALNSDCQDLSACQCSRVKFWSPAGCRNARVVRR